MMKYNECQMKMKSCGTYYYKVFILYSISLNEYSKEKNRNFGKRCTNNNRTFNGSLRIQVLPDDPPCDGT